MTWTDWDTAEDLLKRIEADEKLSIEDIVAALKILLRDYDDRCSETAAE